MGTFTKLITFTILITSFSISLKCQGNEFNSSISQSIKLKNQENPLKEYITAYNKLNYHDMSTLRLICINMLKHGLSNGNPTIKSLSIYGSGISNTEETLNILEKGLSGYNPFLRLFCLNSIAQSSTESAINIIKKEAKTSPFIPERLFCSYFLSRNRINQSGDIINNLIVKLPEQFHIYIPELLCPLDDKKSQLLMKKLLINADENIQISAVNACSKFKKTEFIQEINSLLNFTNVQLKESCINSLALLNDYSSLEQIKEHLESDDIFIKTISALSCYNLGFTDGIVEAIAKDCEHNIFSVSVLSDILTEDSTLLLIKLLENKDYNIRLNAAISLLEQGNAACVPFFKELLSNSNEYFYIPIQSPGQTILAYERHQTKASTTSLDVTNSTNNFKQTLLSKIQLLPTESFLELVETVLKNNKKSDAIMLINLLTYYQCDSAFDLLKQYEKTHKNESISKYYSLALYQLGDNTKEEKLKNIISEMKKENVICFSPTESDKKILGNLFTPEETSLFFLKTCEALLNNCEKNLNFILEIMSSGHPHIKYVLSGLILKATK